VVARRFDLNDRLDGAHARNLGAAIPEPLHMRIDELCELVYGARFARPSRKRLIAALLLAAPTDPVELQRLLTNYDAALVGDALVAQPSGGGIVEFPRPKPGPRSRA